ncbi:MAG: hypothetical protein WC314_26220 [Vulcanimicrobiota bacterium]
MEKKQELDPTTHAELLAGGSRRFPLESYRQLRATGTEHKEALEMLGFSEDEVPDEAQD